MGSACRMCHRPSSFILSIWLIPQSSFWICPSFWQPPDGKSLYDLTVRLFIERGLLYQSFSYPIQPLFFEFIPGATPSSCIYCAIIDLNILQICQCLTHFPNYLRLASLTRWFISATIIDATLDVYHSITASLINHVVFRRYCFHRFFYCPVYH